MEEDYEELGPEAEIFTCGICQDIFFGSFLLFLLLLTN